MFRFPVLLLTFSCIKLLGASALPTDPGKNVPQGKNERESLNQLRDKVISQLPEDYMKTDFYLRRWLKAEDFRVDAAYEMLLENLNWRKENNISKILSEDLSDIREDFLITADTHDKIGRPVATIQLGSWDIRVGVLQGKQPRIMRYIDQNLENLSFQIIKIHDEIDKKVNSGIILIDMEGVNSVQHLCGACVPVLLHIIEGMESHYPGFLGEIILINPPATFGTMLALAASAVSKETREVVKYFDSREKWEAYLNETIDKDQRYTNFGGTKEY